MVQCVETAAHHCRCDLFVVPDINRPALSLAVGETVTLLHPLLNHYRYTY